MFHRLEPLILVSLFMTLLLLGNKIIIGAPLEDYVAAGYATVSGYGAVYIWEYEAPSWSMEQRLLFSDYNGAVGAGGFGWQVAILGDKAIVTSPRDGINENGATIRQGGAARVFRQDSVTDIWTMDEVIHSGSPKDYE